MTHIPIRKRKMKYLSKKEADDLNLPLKHYELREDGYTFMYYYKRGDKVYEMWNSPQTMIKVRSRRRKQQKEHVKKTKKYVKRVKLYFGCQVCGYKKCSDALQFDHLDVKSKLREVSKMSSCGFKKIKDEIRKCRVLCANCHAEHTQVQREEGIFDNEINT